jgi:F-type H+-transporting ATPase subunit delta
MASSASVARPYAQAVFELAGETEGLDAWADCLAMLSAVASNADFAAILEDPRVDDDQISNLLTGLVADRLPEGGENFIRLLVRNDRVEVLPDISKQYDLRVAEARKSINAEVVTAQALSDEQKENLSSSLASRLGCTVTLTESVDAGLLGGAVVKAGDLVIDGSAAGRIRKLAINLAR